MKSGNEQLNFNIFVVEIIMIKKDTVPIWK